MPCPNSAMNDPDTRRRLPEGVRGLFRNYRADELDLERHAALIIPQVLTRGTWAQTKWLFRQYGWDGVKRAFLDDLARAHTMPESAHVLWATVFDIPLPKPPNRWAVTRGVDAGHVGDRG